MDYGVALNAHTEELISEFRKANLFDIVSTSIFASVLIFSAIVVWFYLSKKREQEVAIMCSLFLIVGFGTYWIANNNYTDVKEEIDTFKRTYVVNANLESSEKVEVNKEFFDAKSATLLKKYIASLEKQSTKSYSDIQYTDSGKSTFYFKGKKYIVDNNELLHIKENKKPVMTYKVINKNIIGIVRKDTVVNIDFAVNY